MLFSCFKNVNSLLFSKCSGKGECGGLVRAPWRSEVWPLVESDNVLGSFFFFIKAHALGVTTFVKGEFVGGSST